MQRGYTLFFTQNKNMEKEKKSIIKMQFNPQIAKDIGVEEAIMYSNIEFWVEHNRANNKNFHEGKYWTYNSMEAFSKLFWFWSDKQIRRILNNLESKGYIITDNFNEHKYDRTKWYTTNCPNGQMENPKEANGKFQMGEPIPDNKPNNKPYTSIDIEKTPKQIAQSFFNLEDNEDNRDIILPLREKYGKEIDVEIKKFISYWTEPNGTGKKQKWELQKTFDVKRRLITWLSNYNKFNPQKQERTIIGMEQYNF